MGVIKSVTPNDPDYLSGSHTGDTEMADRLKNHTEDHTEGQTEDYTEEHSEEHSGGTQRIIRGLRVL